MLQRYYVWVHIGILLHLYIHAEKISEVLAEGKRIGQKEVYEDAVSHCMENNLRSNVERVKGWIFAIHSQKQYYVEWLAIYMFILSRPVVCN